MMMLGRLLRILTLVILSYGESRCQTSADSIAGPWTLNDLHGNTQSLTDHAGKKLTIILFWATWGNDSIEMLDTIERLYEKYRGQGLGAVGICVERQEISDTTLLRITDVIRLKKISFPILLDHQLATFRRYGVIAVPTTFALDGNGKIVHKLSGYPIVGREQFFDVVREQFEGKQTVVVHKKFEREPDKKALRLFNMAQMKFDRDQLDTAKKYAREAAAEDSMFLEPSILLTEIAIEEKDYPGAALHNNRSLQLDPTSVPARALTGLLAVKKGETALSVRILEEIMRDHDSSAVVHCYLGYALGIIDSIDRSLVEFSRAEALAASDYRVPMLRAEIYARVGKQKEAMNEKIKAKRLRTMR